MITRNWSGLTTLLPWIRPPLIIVDIYLVDFYYDHDANL
jgi:hypothetical protein